MNTRAVVAVCMWLAASAAGQAADTRRAILPGFVDDNPVIFVPLRPGTLVRLVEIGYGKYEKVKDYRIEITAAGKTTVLKIAKDPALKPADKASYRYILEIDDKAQTSPTLAEWEKQDMAGYVGFVPAAPGGAYLETKGPQEEDFTTGFAYDDFGRRMISKQEFATEGVKYVIAYTETKFGKFGYLSGYAAEIKLRE